MGYLVTTKSMLLHCYPRHPNTLREGLWTQKNMTNIIYSLRRYFDVIWMSKAYVSARTCSHDVGIE